MARFYFHKGAAHELPEGEELPRGAVEIARLPGDGERINRKTGEITLDPVLALDLHRNVAAVAAAHVQKQVEAALVLSGYELTAGLLAEEAAATGEELPALAKAVYAKAAPARAAEVERRSAKAKARRKG